MFFKKTLSALVPKKEVRELEDPRQILRTGSTVGSFLERSRVKGGTKVVQAQEEFVRSLGDLEHAFAGLAEARVTKGQAIRMLEDAETIYESDAQARQRQLLSEQNSREAAEQQLEIERMDREMALARKRAEYEAFMRQQSGAAPNAGLPVEPAAATVPPTGRSQEHQEFEADRDQVFGADEARFETEARIAALVRNAGGEESLTPEQKAIIARMRQKLEELIRESGYA